LKRFILLIIFIIASYSDLQGVVINEIMPKPFVAGEWVELYNESADRVNLKGWSIIDAAGNEGLLDTVDIFLSSGEFLIAAKDSETVVNLNLEPSIQILIPQGWFPMNNDGDRLTLRNEDRISVDEIVYSSIAGRVAGRSWERINPSAPGTDENNWGPCAEIAGHTAGKQNSISTTPIAGASVKVDPNPFNPYQGESAQIIFNLPVPTARITVEVYDVLGRKVRRIAGNIPAGPRSPDLYWNGRNDSGSLMPIGRYIIFIQAVDNRGGKVPTAKCTVVVADQLK